MNRLQLLQGFIKGYWDDVFIRNLPAPESDEGILNRPYEKSDLVYVCISTTARAISQVPLGVYGQKDGNWQPLPDESPVQKKLQRPNFFQDVYTFVEALVTGLMLEGAVFVAPDPPQMRSRLEAVDFWVIRNKFMKPIRSERNGSLIGWRYQPREGVVMEFDISEVSMIYFYNPADPFGGFAPIKAGKIPITTDYKAARFNQIFFDNNASIGGYLQTDNVLNEKSYQRLKEEIKARSGFREAHKPMVIDAGLKYQSSTFSHKDMMFENLRNMDKEKILQIFGMKKSIISVTDDLNFATAKEQRKSWWQDTNLPMMRLITSALNFTYYEALGFQLRFDTSAIEALQEDYHEKVKTAERLFGMGFSSNEVNDLLALGFEANDKRDKLYVKSAFKEVADEEEIDIDETPAPEEEPEEDDDGETQPDDGDDEGDGSTTPGQETIHIEASIYDSVNNLLDFNTIGKVIWKAIDSRAYRIEQSFRGKVSRAFFEYRLKVMEWFYAQKPKAVAKDSDRPFILTRPLEEIDNLGVKAFNKLKKECDSLYLQALQAGIETLSVMVPESIPIDILGLPEAQAFLAERQIEIKGLKDTVAKQLRRNLSKGMSEGEGIEKLANRIKRDFKIAANRTKTIARTETWSSLNYGRDVTMRNSKFTKEQWFTAGDELVRLSHAPLHGLIKAVNDGTQWPIGVNFPGDPAGPASEVINCRCIVVPVMDSYESY